MIKTTSIFPLWGHAMVMMDGFESGNPSIWTVTTPWAFRSRLPKKKAAGRS